MRVWCWAVADGADIVGYGQSIESFMLFVSSHPELYYFHNLKFDGSFIVDWLLRHSYRHVEGRPSKPGTFSSLIGDDGSWYCLRINAKGNLIEIRDSMKKLTMTIADMPGAFGFDGVAKGEIDYTRVRPPGYTPSDDEWEYVFADVRILGMAMAVLYEQGMTALTFSADTFTQYKTTIDFRKFFPALSAETDDYLRRAYRGGFTYADPRFTNTVHDVDGIVVDANSMYPSVMYYDQLPYGEPEPVDEMPSEGLWIGRMQLDIHIKPGHIPCLSETRHVLFGSAADYADHLEGEFTLTSVDWELVTAQYDIVSYTFLDGFRFRSTNRLFRRHIDHWYEVKQNSTGGRRLQAKYMLNSLYGRFGKRTVMAHKIPRLNDGGVVCFDRSADEDVEPEYIPVAAFVTAHARRRLITAAQANYGTFAYCDTDSLHLLGGEVRGVEIHESDLGAWKIEGRFDMAVYRRAKQYAERFDGVMDVHIAGLPRRIAGGLSFDDLLHGCEVGGKLVPKRVPGGVRLVETTFKL